MTREQLRTSIIESLTSQGFYVNGHVVPSVQNKQHFREIQANSKKEQLRIQSQFIKQHIPLIEKFLLNGWDINPYEIDLELKVVTEGSVEEILFRWWNLTWWSVPYQKPYGRQMRFLLWDKAHNAPMGLIGLQSPILRMSVRDEYLNIPKAELDYWINQSMQAQRLGALPPYNQLIGGKMAALALTSNELRDLYKEKYWGVKTLLKDRVIDSELLFLTTTSAFGKSSIYNRLKYNDHYVAKSLGFTKGSGSFHISKTIYAEIKKFLNRNKIDTNTSFGYGPSRKVKLLYQAFSLLGLKNYHYHNIHREFFIFLLISNLEQVIHEKAAPIFYDRPLEHLEDFWRKRWAIPRFERCNGWIDFDSGKFMDDLKASLNI